MSGCVCTQTTRTRRPHTAARIKTRCESLDTYDSEPDHKSAALTVDAHTTVDSDASRAGCELGVEHSHLQLGFEHGHRHVVAISRYLTQKGHRAKQVVDFGLVASRRRKRYRPLAAHNLL